MIYHCIRFTIKPDVPKETADAIVEGLGAQSTGDSSGVFGRDFGGEYQYGAVSAVEDLETYEKMMNDPAHLAIDRMGLPLIEKFASFDITDDPDPEMDAKLAAIHQRRFDATPDLVELISNLKEYKGSAAPGKHAA
ncbi:MULTISPECIES: Dabb family protein [Actinoalloteichus]|uniref:Stress responsive A/B Barrel Domain-containing protein n=1 Tax=Actinoalloteichus fjordicus TaxID=1612552 RepID=A0AAC9LDC3_9PSEU|nr:MULTISPECIES: Dabb family protein [Actinoalloteichus]APU14249.1 Stress responsive A/B Barrel Domain-containing protein [Actinoalloteichus fjordicus]APU20218.1 Stress responsive A/B Barrel Domain-containing protein [Actinoalloteichus sp. GBA129-24]